MCVHGANLGNNQLVLNQFSINRFYGIVNIFYGSSSSPMYSVE